MIQTFGDKETLKIWNGEVSRKLPQEIQVNHRLSLKYSIMEQLPNIHPGEILLEEFMVPLGVSAYRLAKEVYIPQTRISEILKGRRRITADTAIRLARFFGTSAKFWLSLQDDFDLEQEQKVLKNQLNEIKPLKIYAA